MKRCFLCSAVMFINELRDISFNGNERYICIQCYDDSKKYCEVTK